MHARAMRLSPLTWALLLAWLVGGAPAAAAAQAGQPAAGFPLTATAVGNASAALSWGAPAEAAGYSVYAARTVAFDPLAAESVEWTIENSEHPLAQVVPGQWISVAQGLREPSVTLTDLPPEGVYAFVVRALSRDGTEVAQSTVAEVSLAEAPGDGIVLDVPTPGVVQLSWEVVPSAARYAVLVGQPEGPLLPDPSHRALQGTTVQIAPLPVGSTWRFAVVAQDERGGVLARSEPTEVTMPPPSVFLLP